MDTYMHKTMVSLASLEKIEIIKSQEFMLSKVRQKFLKKIIILRPKTAILGPQFCQDQYLQQCCFDSQKVCTELAWVQST